MSDAPWGRIGIALGLLAALLLAALGLWGAGDAGPGVEAKDGPVVAAAPSPRPVPVPVGRPLVRPQPVEEPGEALQEAVKEPPTQIDTAVPELVLVMPVGDGPEGCDQAAANTERLEELLAKVKTAELGQRRRMMRELGPLSKANQVEGCEEPDHSEDVKRVLCAEIYETPDDEELALIIGFAGIECDH